MSATPVWIPVSSAAAALLGGGFGAMLQGRYGVSGWRRQTRLEAYTGFVNATHDFNACLTDALDAFCGPKFDEKWAKVRDAVESLGRAGSLVSIAGPLRVDLATRPVVSIARSILEDGNDSEKISVIVRDRKEGKRYKRNQDWVKSAYEFADIARKTLRTHRTEWRFR